MSPSIRRVRSASLALIIGVLVARSTRSEVLPGAGAGEARLVLQMEGRTTRILYVSAEGLSSSLRSTEGSVHSEQVVRVPDAGVLFASWEEVPPAPDEGARGTATGAGTEPGVAGPTGGVAGGASGGGTQHLVTLSLDGGVSWSRPQSLTFDIPLKAGRLVPGISAPSIPEGLRSVSDDRLFIVQLQTTGIEAWRRILRSLGAEVLSYLPEHAHIVRMDPSLVPAVAAQPFVRWVGSYEPGYKVEPAILEEILSQNACCLPRRYHLQTFTPGPEEKEILAGEVRSLGGRIDLLTPNGYLLDATLSLEQVIAIARSEHLLWLDRWSAPENDMDIVREQDGANYVESAAGYSGQGVSGEVMDCGFQQSHQDFDGVNIHGPAPSACDHGNCTYGIVFGNGDRDGDGVAKATGNIPSAQGWFYDYDNLTDRYQETADLVRAPIFAVFQSNSWGDSLTQSYNSISSQMDDIIWINDIAIFQSQSNTGNQSSRPQAWAKNIISIGAAHHYDTPTLTDDCWCSGASIGPAEDGRIKPDLAYWYDWIYTTDADPGGYASGPYYDQFGGTSAATPICAGIGGLFFQMWADNVLGNNPSGTTVFEKRPHSSTLKALMINTAEQYPFSGTAHDLTRTHQGWGLPSARRFYDRAPLMKVADETQLLKELDTHIWSATVPAGQAELKVTMVYTDRAGTTSSTQHRINDVTLKVIDPAGTTWWGNNGLDLGNWSASGGSADTKNTVENVFIQNPAAGGWTIQITADDINQDEHSETPEVDQDYALVVYGVSSLTFGCPTPPPAPAGLTATPNGDNRVDVSWTATSTPSLYKVYRSAGGCGGTYALIGTVPNTQTSFSDTSASGGSTYGYVVRAAESCESVDSNCAPATATGPCLLAPGFAGAASASSNNAATCGITVSWAGATTNCGGPVRYNVYRSSSAGFIPADSNRVASCVVGTSFVDTRNIAGGQTYNYIVRAEDLGGRGSVICGGSTESNTASRSAAAQGPTAALMDEGFESGLDGWTPAKGSPPATAGDFEAGDPMGSTNGGAQAQPENCATGTGCLFTLQTGNGPAGKWDVDGGEVLASSPAFSASGYSTARLTLNRWHYNSGTVNDSGDHFALDVSNDNGGSWANLETIGPRVSVNSWTQVAFDLQNYRPLTSQMKIRVRSADGTLVDAVVESAIDTVHVDGIQICSTQAPAAPGESGPTSLRVAREGTKLRLDWGADCGGGVSYGLYRGDLASGYSSLSPLSGNCGIGAATALIDPGSGSYFFLLAPNDGSVEGSLGKRSDGTLRPQPSQRCYPRANPIAACAQ